MLPASSQRTGTRRGQVPGTLVLDWQSKGSHARRPMTACEACRLAKVKCNGKRQCERCKHRQLHCAYTNDGSSSSPSMSSLPPMSMDSSVVTRPSRRQNGVQPNSQAASEAQTWSAVENQMPVDASSAAATTSVGIDALSQSGQQRDPDWPHGAFSHALEQLDWIFSEEIDFNVRTWVRSIQTNFAACRYCWSKRSNLWQDQISGMGSSMDSTMETSAHQQNSSGTPYSDLLPDDSQALAINQGSNVHTGKQECHCRVGLLSHIPELEAVMEEKSKPHIDEMFKVTSDVIRSCCSAVSCTKCYLGPVDLVCVLTVFQQTSYCFQQISQSGLSGGETKVGIGNYEILLSNDAGIKRLLVLNLVEQASVLLDDLSSHAESLFLAENPPSRKQLSRSPACLNQLNLDYVQEVTTRFRKLFKIVVNVFEGKGPDAGS